MNKQVKSLMAAAAIAISAGVPLSMTMNTAPAQAHGYSCAPTLKRLFKRYRRFFVYGSGVSVSKSKASQFFTMFHSYNVKSGLANKQAITMSRFLLHPDSDNRGIHGAYGEVFPTRGYGKRDLATLQIRDSGKVRIALNSKNENWKNLTNVYCLPGYKGKQFILSGTLKRPNRETRIYRFVLVPNMPR